MPINSQILLERASTTLSNTEVCYIIGHATLATSHVLFTQQMVPNEQINFNTKSGVLIVTRNSDGYSMDFPAVSPL